MRMEKIESLLVSVDRNRGASHTLAQAIALGHKFGARIELFVCDAERAFALKHEYDTHGVDEARASCLLESRRYLETLLEKAPVGSLPVCIDAMCESPLYEGIVHKVQQSCPDLVVRSVGGGETQSLSASDWALVRTCPVPLLLTHGKPWHQRPRIAAAVDISDEEPPALTRSILRAAAFVSASCGGVLEVLYGAGAAAGAGGAEKDRALTKLHAAELRARAKDAGAQAENVHVLIGDPAKMLPRHAADRHYDLVVLGALTHQKAMTALVGTLTGRLIESLDCDVLLVKPVS